MAVQALPAGGMSTDSSAQAAWRQEQAAATLASMLLGAIQNIRVKGVACKA